DICPSKDLKAAVTDEQFDAFWVLYPRKEAKKDARKAFKAVLRDGAKLETIMAAVPLYAAKVAGKDAEFIKLAGGWLRGERFEDYAGGVAPPGRPMRQFSVAEKQAYVARHSLTGASRPIIEAKLSETGDLGRWEWAR